MKRLAIALLPGMMVVFWAASATAGINPIFPFPSPFCLV